MAENGVGGRALDGRCGCSATATTTPAATCRRRAAIGAAAWCFRRHGARSVVAPCRTTTCAPRSPASRCSTTVGTLTRRGGGVALNLAWLLPAVESFVGHRSPSCASAVGAQSDLVAQMLADALDRPVHQLQEPRAANAIGAAFLAFADSGALALRGHPRRCSASHAVRRPQPRCSVRRWAALVRRSSPCTRTLDQSERSVRQWACIRTPSATR